MDEHKATYSRAGTLEMGTSGEAVGLKGDQELQSEQKQSQTHNHKLWAGLGEFWSAGRGALLGDGGGNCKLVF